jgi:hypothetical protein
VLCFRNEAHHGALARAMEADAPPNTRSVEGGAGADSATAAARASHATAGGSPKTPKSDHSKKPKPKEIYKKKSIKIEKENIKEYKNDLSNFSH